MQGTETGGVNDREISTSGSEIGVSTGSPRGASESVRSEMEKNEGFRAESGDSGKDLTTSAANKAQRVTQQAAHRMHRAASALRERSNGGSDLKERVTGNAAMTIDQAASYIENFSLSQVRNDLGGVIRRYPLQSLAVGVGLGFIFARTLRK